MMDNIKSFIISHTEVARSLNDKKLWLEQKAVIEYNKYLQEGGNTRTARDKVISELILKDTQDWAERELRYSDDKITMQCYDNIMQIVKGLVGNGKEDMADKLISGLKQEIGI